MRLYQNALQPEDMRHTTCRQDGMKLRPCRKSTGWVRWLTENWGNQSTIRRELTSKNREEAAEGKCWRGELRYKDDKNMLPIWEASIDVRLIEYM